MRLGDESRAAAEVQRALIAAARAQAREIRLRNESEGGFGDDSSIALEQGSDSANLTFLTPDSFPGFQIERQVHRGGQGVVYKAIQKSTRRPVAIKVMKEGIFASPVERSRFDREVQILGQARHPNIVTIHGAGVAQGHHFYVMDYVDGQPLHTFVAERKCGVVEIICLFAKIAEAVNAAHLRGIIHRDLKPSNVLIDEAGEPHLVDFGLAKTDSAESTLPAMTVTGQFVGSLPWASPEQASGAVAQIDVRTDVYSLGVMLYHTLTDRFPYEVVGDIRNVIERIIEVDPVRLSVVRREIDHEIETIVLKCLEKHPSRRYQSAGELARDLRRYLAGEPIEAKRDSTIYILRKQLRRHSVPVVIVLAFVVIIVVGLFTSAAGWKRAALQRDQAEAAQAQAQAVTDFLVETLKTANPYAGPGPSITIGEVLDAAAERLDTSFEDRPLVRAAVYESIGYQYDALALSAKAEDAAQRALKLRRLCHPSDHHEIATSLRQCAMAANRMAKFAEAEALAHESLEMSRRLWGGRHLAVADSLITLGIALTARGGYPQAEPFLREGAEQAEEFLGPIHATTINAEFRHACCLFEQGRLDEAKPIMERCVTRGREALGPEHPEVANMLSSYGETLQLQGVLEGAEAAHRESLAIRRKIFGGEHVTIANSLSNLGFLLVAQGRYSEAEPLYEQSLNLRRSLYGPRRVEVTYALIGLARLYNRTQRAAEAEALLREALGIFDETLPNHWRRAYAECLLGESLTLQGSFEEAESLFVDGAAQVRRARGDQDIFTREVLQYVVDFYETSGRAEAAAPYARLLAEGKAVATDAE